MVSVLSLWLPILLAAVIVFVASSIIHMVFTYHNSDFGKLPQEDKIRESLQAFDLPQGLFSVPHAADNKERQTDAYKEKLKQGPVALLTVLEKGEPKMGASLVLWFLYSILVGVFAAYIAGRALEPGAYYLEVFRFTGATAFCGYALALLQGSIWYNQPWSVTIKNVIDGLIYALLTAGVFGWLWPAA